MREGRIRLFIPCKGGAGQGARGQLEMCYHFVEWSLGFNGASDWWAIIHSNIQLVESSQSFKIRYQACEVASENGYLEN